MADNVTYCMMLTKARQDTHKVSPIIKDISHRSQNVTAADLKILNIQKRVIFSERTNVDAVTADRTIDESKDAYHMVKSGA